MLQAKINNTKETSVKKVAVIESVRQGMLTQLSFMRTNSFDNEYLAKTEQMVVKMQGEIDSLLSQEAKRQNEYSQLFRETTTTLLEKFGAVEDGAALQDAEFDYPPE